MGAWGTAIFSSDAACEARHEWRARLVRGEDPASVSRAMVSAVAAPGPEDTEWWTGLALAQHQTGHLQDDVRDAVLALVAAGGDLELYDDDPARARALARLADQLRGPQPKPKRLRGPRKGPAPGVDAGDVVRVFSTDRTRSMLFAVLDLRTVDNTTWPTVLALAWDGTGDVPPAAAIPRLPYLSSVDLTALDGDAASDRDVAGASPEVFSLMASRPGDEFTSAIGEVVARGVRFPAFDDIGPPGDHRGGWPSVVGYLDDDVYALHLDATRRRVALYGPGHGVWRTGFVARRARALLRRLSG